MHEKAVESLHKKIIGYFKSCEFSQGKIEWSDTLMSLSKEIARQHPKYFNEYDAIGIIYNISHKLIKLELNSPPESEGNLQNILGEENILKISDGLLKYLTSLPHKIHAELRIPSIKSSKELSIACGNQVSIEFKPTKYPRGLLAMLGSEAPNFELSLTTNIHGAASWNADSISSRALLSSQKILLQRAIQQKRLLHTGFDDGLIISALHQDDHRIRKSEITITELLPFQREFGIDLPIEICAFIEKLSLPNSGDTERQIEELISCFKSSSELIEDKSEDGAKIKAAIEWSFDSLTAENSAMAFLKACIGLEALLGDANVDQPLTEMLADRCSYLIAGNIAGRKMVKEKFKEIYKTRSKIVHGVVTHMSKMDIESLIIARSFLYAAINKEIKYLLSK